MADDLDTDDLFKRLEKLLQSSGLLEAIDALRMAIDGPHDDIVKLFRSMEGEIKSLRVERDELQNEVDNEDHTYEGSEDAINNFLDVVARPVGTQRFSVPESSEANRAILGLYDAVGRNL